MRKAALFVAVALPLVVFGCKKKDEEPPPAAGGYQPGQQGYPQQQGTYPQQQGTGTYPQQGGTYPQQGGTYPQQGTPTTVPTAGQMSTPSPMAFPCQTDAQCFTHRCNTAAGKCAWPCQSDADCAPGNRCMAPQCVPSGGAR